MSRKMQMEDTCKKLGVANMSSDAPGGGPPAGGPPAGGPPMGGPPMGGPPQGGAPFQFEVFQPSNE